jgi:5-(carboxyamino)imidazole ribonucleotide synthase
MGGGQLGRMFVHAAQRMGYFTAVLDPDAGSPAGRVSHHHVRTDYLDEIGLASWPAVRRHHHRIRERAGAARWRCWPPPPGGAGRGRRRHRAGPHRGKGALHRAAACPARPMRWSKRGGTRRCSRRLAARHPEDRPPGLRRQGPGPRGKPRELRRRLGRLKRRPACWRSCCRSSLRVLGGRGARLGRPHGAPAGAAQPAPRRHPGRHRGATKAMRARGAGAARIGGHPRHRESGPGLRRRALRRVLRSGRRLAGGQRDGAAPAQQRPLEHGRRRRLAVRAAGAHAMAGLPLVQPRQHSPPSCSTCWATCGSTRGGKRARPTGPAVLALPGTHLHLYGKPSARPGRKMGHLTHHRRRVRRRARHGLAGGGPAGHRPF